MVGGTLGDETITVTSVDGTDTLIGVEHLIPDPDFFGASSPDFVFTETTDVRYGGSDANGSTLALGGDDTLYGGDGNDGPFAGDAGSDMTYGGAGNDLV